MVNESIINETVKRLFEDISFPAEPSGLYDPLRYMIAIGGKRIRPKLCIITWSLFKDNLSEEILEPAAALEIFHTFTLIHDDIMDKSPLRRNSETVWKKWNEDTAILSGDVMSIESYRRIAMAPKDKLPKVLELFSKTAAEVCEGQQYDMDFEEVAEVPMEDYMKMIGLKTAVLLACSAKMGAIISGASDEEADALYDYGYKLGLAFQVADDYLDAYGDEKVFGKPIGGDIVNDKKSWLLTHALEKIGDKQELFKLMEMPVDDEAGKKAKIAAVKEIYNRLEVDKDAREEVKRLTEEAMRAARRLDVGGARINMLKRFADSLVGRAS